ncbi:histidine phosphatase family protein [Paenibacillus sambharensis]|uniref:Histidine phosphatase family protein n=1 Tax=Paenibacillus sambharensis TaxID=1803190 RepID=A0A2W1LR33_9BACL|nr:histidine phosphatase family protein [Paenibacillus sambharensis]PZD97305.1 histidine phosphatase family protein [Paenibacillus sambharensis]
MKEIYLIRHCKAAGQEPEAVLTGEGVQQAEQLAAFFGGLPIDYIVSSPFTRAIATIKPLANIRQLEIHLDERLAERVLSSENLADWMEQLEATYEDLDKRLPGGETSREAMQRGVSVVEEVNSMPIQRALLVTHGNLMSLMLHRYMEHFGFKDWLALSNPDIYKLTVHEESDAVTVRRVWR